MGMWENLRQRLGWGAGVQQDDEKPVALLRHFMEQLDDEFFYAKSPTNEPAVKNDEIVKQLDALFAERDTRPLTWGRVYKIERLLVYVRPPSRLRNETDRRVAEAERQQLSAAAKYRAQLDQATGMVTAAAEAVKVAAAEAASPSASADAAQKLAHARDAYTDAQNECDVMRRSILAAALDDLQWFYQQRILKRHALWKSASRLLTLGLICLAVVALPFFGFLFGKLTGSQGLVGLMEKFPNYGLFTAMSFGMLGAFFSRLISFQFSNEMTVEAAEYRYGFKSLSIRCGVGVFGAIIVYYLLQTGFIGTNYKPDFTNLGYDSQPVVTMLSGDARNVLLPSKDWCLLVLWSFLAGFSERLVPDTLARIDGELAGQKK
jgi:hypothetical protein